MLCTLSLASSGLILPYAVQKILRKHKLRICFPTATATCNLDKEDIIFILICLELVIIFLLQKVHLLSSKLMPSMH